MSKEIRDLLGLKNIAQTDLRGVKTSESWDITFMKEALLWSERSHDADTQCGTVLVRDKTPLSTGYNGFVRDIDDTVLPNIRPHKYPFMMHSEVNAICNCARQGKSTIGATCYTTTKPCLQCFQLLYQAGIQRIVYSNLSMSKNYNHADADDHIEAMMMLINDVHRDPWSGIVTTEFNLTMCFIDKNDVLPQ